MSELNTERALVRIVREVAERHGVEVHPLGQGWILRLLRRTQVRYVHGYTFDLNPAATHQIACDKAATSEVLSAMGVPHVPHTLFLHPDMARFVRHAGNWKGLLELVERLGSDVVIKDNQGTGGRGVYRCTTPVAVENACLRLFDRCQAIAVSPFVDAAEEVRFIILGDRCEAAYTKQRPSVVGDGRKTVLELLSDRVAGAGMSGEIARFLTNIEPDSAAILTRTPSAGQEVLLNWRHNLGQGAGVAMLDVATLGSSAFGPAMALATHAAKGVGLVFGSVDVIIDRAGAARVLEINSGVMMEALAGSASGMETARRIYGRAFQMMFATGDQE
jgi:glutathione synthase/RimK-type ligase-like ATP-grasp enzyme